MSTQSTPGDQNINPISSPNDSSPSTGSTPISTLHASLNPILTPTSSTSILRDGDDVGRKRALTSAVWNHCKKKKLSKERNIRKY